MTRTVFHIFDDLVKELVPYELPESVYQQWIDNPEILENTLYKALATFPKLVDLQSFPSYSVPVDYDLSVEAMAKLANLNVDAEVTNDHFPSDEKGKKWVNILLFKFDLASRTLEAIKNLDSLGLRPATLKELLALLIANPDAKSHGNMVALGSRWEIPYADNPALPIFRELGKKKDELTVANFSDTWSSYWYFLAVEKS